MKKLIMILLACLLMIGLVACTGPADPTEPTDPSTPSTPSGPSVEDGYSKGLTYELNADGTTCTITGIGTCTDTVVKIPKAIDGHKVTAIGKADAAAGAGAFSGNASVKEVVIPKGVQKINPYAFENCTALESVTIPDSVTALNMGAFSGCTALKTVTMDVIGTSIIGDAAFKGCTSLTTLNLPVSITSIGESAFENCEKLTTVNIPDDIPLGWHVLHGTAIFNDENNWEDNALYFGNHLLAVKDTIGEEFFIKDGTVDIVGDVFAGLDVTNIYIPDSVKRIGKEAFANCTKLQRIELGEGVAAIEAYAFKGCTILNFIQIEKNLSVIGEGAFDGCDTLKQINFRGTTTQWRGLDNKANTGRFDIYCIDAWA